MVLVESLQKEFQIPQAQLPSHASEGTHLILDIEGDSIIQVEVDEEKTRSSHEKATSKLEQLRSKRGGSGFKRR